MRSKHQETHLRQSKARIVKHRLRYFFALTAVVLLATPSLAGPYSQLFIFGDSLSDIGNIAQFPLLSTPGPYYDNGRFSNGPVYSEMLSVGLGLGTLTPSFSGGDNYAYGGAQTTGTSFPSNLFVDDIDDQVSDYLSGGSADPNALYVLFGGANDLFNGQANVNVPVNSLVADIQSLVSAQARNFLVMNLPLLGSTPRFNGDPIEAAAKTAITQGFNSALSTALDTLETSQPGINLFRFDTAGLIEEAIADPTAFGLTNVTDPAAPGLSAGDTSYDTNLIVSNPEEYLFWDDIHPTTAAHALLAEHVLTASSFAADFDFDGDVDYGDLSDPILGWESRFGEDLAGPDFLTWQQQLGENLAPLLAVQTTPEPASSTLLVGMFCCGLLTRFGKLRHGSHF